MIKPFEEDISRIKKRSDRQFLDSMVRAQAFREKGFLILAIKKEVEAIWIKIRQNILLFYVSMRSVLLEKYWR